MFYSYVFDSISLFYFVIFSFIAQILYNNEKTRYAMIWVIDKFFNKVSIKFFYLN